MQANLLERFTSYWVDVAPLSPVASQLATASRIVYVQGDADESLGRLADAHAALRMRQARHPLTLIDAVAAVKRDLSGGHVAISSHDRLRSELARLRDLPELGLAEKPDGESYGRVAARVVESALPAAATIATLAYWGDETTDQWWMDELRQFSGRTETGGLVSFLELPIVAGRVLYQAAAVAALAARRYSVLRGLFTRQASPQFGRVDRLSERLAACEGNGPAPSAAAAEVLKPIFVEHLSLGRRAFSEAWETHDVLHMCERLVANPDFDVLAGNLATTMLARQQNGGGESPASPTELRPLTELVGVRGHVRFSDSVGSPLAQALAREVRREGATHALAQAGFGHSSARVLEIALMSVAEAVRQEGDRVAWKRLRSGIVPDYLWVDTGARPDFA